MFKICRSRISSKVLILVGLPIVFVYILFDKPGTIYSSVNERTAAASPNASIFHRLIGGKSMGFLSALGSQLGGSDTESHNSVDQVPENVNIEKFLGLELGDNWQTSDAFSCLQTSISIVKFPICLYRTNEDVWVSGTFHANGYWEQYNVNKMINFFNRVASRYNSTLSLIDIGANIGTYTLPLAHLGYSVLAVEPNRATMTRLSSSVFRGNITDKVKLFRVGVSNKRGRLHLGENLVNRGDTSVSNCTFNASSVVKSLTDEEAQKQKFTAPKLCLNDSVSTVLLDDFTDIVPHRRAVIKIDIQCGETRALSSKTSSKFFAQNYIPLILMEWECYGPSQQNPIERSLIEDFMTFFISMNYTVHTVHTGKQMTVDEWQKNKDSEVVLIKKELTGDHLWS